MSDESELEKYAKRKNDEARQHATDVENSDYFWGNCIKFVVVVVVIVVVFVVLFTMANL